MKYRQFIFALMLSTALGLANVYAGGSCAKANTDSTCMWSFDPSSGTLTISGAGQMEDYPILYDATHDEATSPWKSHLSSITNIEVQDGISSLGEGAFYQASQAVSITIPQSVTSIKARALQAISAPNITLPQNLQSLGLIALGSNPNLQTITLPNTLTSIDDWLFAASALTSITIPSNIKTIGGYAFYATNLTSIEIPSTVERIGDYAFRGCNSLTSITISDNTVLGKIFGSESTVLDLSKITVYCKGDNKTCDSKLKAAGYDIKSKVYRNNRRIYTIDEANKDAGTKNRVSIRYR